jgi:hypothetical protein
MNLEELEITIDKDGQVSVHVHGVKGQACLDLTKSLEDALGGEVILREMTPEALENQNQDWLGNNLEIKRRA